MTNFDVITESPDILAREVNLMHHCDPIWQKDFLDWLNSERKEDTN
jgi:hypothetical protein